jgi:acetolactate synthase-1/2/3 large subunit
MTVAEKIAEWLYEKGITHAYGIVGGGNVPLWDAITRLEKTKIVCVHHEQAAAMASGYHNRMCRGLGSIALVTTGGGSTNAITGVIAAYMDNVPMLVVSGNEASRYMNAKTRVWGVQGYDSSRVADKFVKQSARILCVEDWSFKLEFCRQLSLEAPGGPVWVDLPKDIQSALV